MQDESKKRIICKETINESIVIVEKKGQKWYNEKKKIDEMIKNCKKLLVWPVF